MLGVPLPLFKKKMLITPYSSNISTGGVTKLIVYVDNIIISGENKQEATELENQLAEEYDIKKPRPLKYFLGFEITRSSEELLLTQQKYILDLLSQTDHLQSHKNDTPIEVNNRLNPNEDESSLVNATSYQNLICKLLYLSHTHPNISYRVKVLSQFINHPQGFHFQAAQRVLRCLKGMAALRLTFRKTGKLNFVITQTLTLPDPWMITGQQLDIHS